MTNFSIIAELIITVFATIKLNDKDNYYDTFISAAIPEPMIFMRLLVFFGELTISLPP